MLLPVSSSCGDAYMCINVLGDELTHVNMQSACRKQIIAGLIFGDCRLNVYHLKMCLSSHNQFNREYRLSIIGIPLSPNFDTYVLIFYIACV